jgi:PAS domain S-box-containing protein
MHGENTILVIEDDRDFAINLKDILEERGFRVELAPTGAEGIEMAESDRPDLVLLDLRLPDMTGIEVMRRLKASTPKTEIIVETGYGSLDTAVQALEMGAYSYITKPVDVSQLMTLADRAIERAEIKRSLEESEESYRTFFERSPDAILVADLEGRVLWANASAAALYGRSETSLCRSDLAELLSEEVFRSAVAAAATPAAMPCEPLEFSLTATGRPVDLECRAGHIRLRGSDLLQVVLRDVTEKKQAEARLTEKLRETFSIIDAIAGFVYVVDAETYRILACNAYGRERLGHDPVGEICHVSFLGRPDPCRICVGAPKDLGEGALPILTEFHDREHSLWYQCVQRMVTWPDGRPVRMIVGLDMTARKKAEREQIETIRDLEALNKASLEISRRLRVEEIMDVAMQVGMAMSGRRVAAFALLDGEGKPAQIRHLGAIACEETLHDLIAHLALNFASGANLLTYGPETHPPELDWDRVSTDLAPYVISIPVFLGDVLHGILIVGGGQKPKEVERAQTLSVLSSALLGISLERAGYYEDLERRLRELQSAYNRLETLDLMKSNILATVSHELRTPLTLIKGYTNTLFEHWDSFPQEQREHMEDIINVRINKLNGLISNLVLAERLQSTVIEPEHEELDLGDLVDRLLADLGEDYTEGSLRRGGLDLKISADPEMVEILLSNLLSNAVKFSPEGGDITVTLGNGADCIRIEVRDEGVGIPADQMDRIFDRFYQVESNSNRTFPGTGLGLFIAKQLALSMQGDITVESEVGKGSTFTLWIPRQSGS